MRAVLLIVVVAVVAVTAGCGGGKKTPATSAAGSTSGTTTNTSTGSNGIPSFASAKNCADMAGLAAKVASAVSAASGNPATLFKTEAAELQALAVAAPSDIRGDFQTFATAFSGFLHKLEQAGYKPGSTATPTAAQIAKLGKAAQSLDTPKLRQAEQHLSAWARQNCKGVKVGG